jgi:DNA mismatch repair protein MutS2
MMEDRYLNTLEFDKIIAQLAGHTSFSASRELALALLPTDDAVEVRDRLQETTEAKALIAAHPDVTVGGARDVRLLAQRAGLNATLLPGELLEVRLTLISARSLHHLLSRLADDYPLLGERAGMIEPLSAIIDEIGRCLDDDGRVLDQASPALGRIRHDAAVARDRLVERLYRIVNSGETAKFLQDPIVTERSGRYVIPLKSEFKGRIPGIIHDQSASGATLFIEPLATVDLNNRWHELQLAEQREIERILAELSGHVGDAEDKIVGNVEALAAIDMALAKGRYSFSLRAAPAELSGAAWPVVEPADVATLTPERHPLNLIRARHPLLPADKVVPIDIHMGGDFTVLLVTGPNTGGKTVSLKTVGLLAATTQAGLHIPATDGSRMPVFTGLYADIGDEQSIEQSLSTFSSHMTRIVDILRHADDGSLVLLDELGAGTDPAEGAALAQALIGTLLTRRCLTMCSTHYSQLKAFAFSTPGVQNASVEFDIETLSPTYRLLIGLPGQSNAFAIAQKLGLSTEIIARAQALISPEDLETDQLLARVKGAGEAATLAHSEAEASRERARAAERELNRKLAAIEEARRQVLDAAREEARAELERVRGELRRLRLGLAPAPAKGVKEPAALAPAPGALSAALAEIEELEDTVAPLAAAPEATTQPSGALQVGDTVLVASLGQTGELLGIDGEDAEVRVGGFRLRTQLGSLEFRGRPRPEPAGTDNTVRSPRVSSPGMELDLRGMRAEEVGAVVARYLDNAYLAGLPWVHIIHGKGTGVLKQVVRQLLDGHPLVASHRPGELSEGGDGITVAKLRAQQ